MIVNERHCCCWSFLNSLRFFILQHRKTFPIIRYNLLGKVLFFADKVLFNVFLEENDYGL